VRRKNCVSAMSRPSPLDRPGSQPSLFRGRRRRQLDGDGEPGNARRQRNAEEVTVERRGGGKSSVHRYKGGECDELASADRQRHVVECPHGHASAPGELVRHLDNVDRAGIGHDDMPVAAVRSPRPHPISISVETSNAWQIGRRTFPNRPHRPAAANSEAVWRPAARIGHLAPPAASSCTRATTSPNPTGSCSRAVMSRTAAWPAASSRSPRMITVPAPALAAAFMWPLRVRSA
jgi:hypothetical protein